MKEPSPDRLRIFGGPRTWIAFACVQLPLLAALAASAKAHRAWEGYVDTVLAFVAVGAAVAMVVGGLLIVGTVITTLAGGRSPFRVFCRALYQRRGLLHLFAGTAALLAFVGASLLLVDRHFGEGSWPWAARLLDSAPDFAAVPTVWLLARVASFGVVALGGRPDEDTVLARARGQEIAATRRTFHAGPTSDSRAAVALLVTICTLACAVPCASALAHRLDPRSFGMVGLLFALVTIASLAAVRHAARVDIGLEGIRIRRAFGSRLLDYRDIEGVRQDGFAVAISQRGGASTTLCFYGNDATYGPIVRGRIERAVEASNRISVETIRSAELAAETRASDAKANHYRATAIPAEELWSLVESPGVTTRARIAAVEALVDGADAHDADRLRLAMDQCIDDESRAALAKAVERA